MAKVQNAVKVVKAEKAEKVVKAKAEKLPVGKKFGGIAIKLSGRLHKAMKKIENSDAPELATIKARLTSITEQLISLHADLVALPDTFTLGKVKGAGGSSKLAVGVTVAIKEKKAAEYDGLLEASDLKGLTVTAIKGNKVVAKAPSGMSLMLPKGHVEVAVSAVA